MKNKRQSLAFLVSFLFIISMVALLPNPLSNPSALADSGAGGQQYLPFLFFAPTWTPTVPPTPGPTLTPTPSNKLPLTSTSIYVRDLSDSAAYDLGCDLGTRDLGTPGKQESVVVLAFAYPQKKNGVFGAYTYVPGIDFASVDQLAAYTQMFGYGYWYCIGDDFDSHLYLGLGTANYTAKSYASVTYEHGQAWSQMVKDVDNWFASGKGCPRGCDGQVSAMGANDIELTWNSPTNSANWVSGYGSVQGAKELINFGALEGCPTLPNPGAQCGNYYSYLWSRDQVLEVTAYPFIRPLPEIYLTNGLHAQQWYLMSKYASNSKKFGRPFAILGPLSQYQACTQAGGCVTTNNTPQKAWDQLFPLINNDEQTRVTMLFSSDMRWGDKATTTAAGSLIDRRPANSTYPNWPKPLSIAIPNQAPDVDLLRLTPRIVDDSKAIIHAWEIKVTNAWEGPYNGQFLYVLAGAAPEDPSQGQIIIDSLDPATSAASRAYFLPPPGTGALRILAVDGSRVSLSTASGGTLTFDLERKQFV